MSESHCPRKMVACKGGKEGGAGWEGEGKHQPWHICEEGKTVITYPMITMLLPITAVINMDPVAKPVLLCAVLTNTDFESWSCCCYRVTARLTFPWHAGEFMCVILTGRLFKTQLMTALHVCT